MSFIYKIDYVCCKKHFEMWLISFSDVGSVQKKLFKKQDSILKKKISLHLLLLRSNTNKIQSILHPTDFVATGRCLKCCGYASEIPNLFNWYINYLSLLWIFFLVYANTLA